MKNKQLYLFTRIVDLPLLDKIKLCLILSSKATEKFLYFYISLQNINYTTK